MTGAGSSKVYSLSDLGRSLNAVVQKNYPGKYWVKAEIARLNYYPKSGHCYPELVEKENGQVKAQMRGHVWANDFQSIEKAFVHATGEQIKDGMNLLFKVSVSFHAVYGISLQIHEVDPSYSLGQMALEKIQTIDRLKKEQVFQLNKQMKLPLLPGRLAVVSVETSKGYHDFCNILAADKRGYAITYKLFPAILQGENAVLSILAQLQLVEQQRDDFDLVLIIRGGGGDIGLNCYDNYNMASRVARFPLPVITGIGHSTNETVTELVAWRNKITPTDVAYFILEQFASFEQRLLLNRQRLLMKTKELVGLKQATLQKMSIHLKHLAASNMQVQNALIEQHSYKLKVVSQAFIQTQMRRMQNVAEGICSQSQWVQDVNTRKLEELSGLIRQHSKSMLEREKSKLDLFREKIFLLDPMHILQRGYGMVFKNDILLKSVQDVIQGDELNTRILDGEISSIVKSVTKSNDGR